MNLMLEAPGIYEGMDETDIRGFADPESEEIAKRKLLPQVIKSLLKLG